MNHWRGLSIFLFFHHTFVVSQFAGVKGGGADVFVQKYVENAERLDWRRVTVFGLFGFIFCGVWQFALFCKIMPGQCPKNEAEKRPWSNALRHSILKVRRSSLDA